MGKWDDRVGNHAVNGAFDNALSALTSLDKQRIEQAPEDVERLLWVVRHVRTRLEHTPAMAVPQATLDQLNTQLTQVVAEVTNFAGNGNVAHLSSAINSADSLLEQARVLRPLMANGEAAEADSYLPQIQGLVAKVVAASNAELATTREAADAAQAEIAGKYDRLSEQLAAVTQRATDIETEVQTQTVRLEEVLSSQAASFADDEKARSEAFAAAEKERMSNASAVAKQLREQFDATEKKLGGQFDAALEKLGEQATATTDQFRGDASGTLRAITEMKTQADELLGAIGVAGVAAGYNETAKQEKQVADKWRRATVAVALIAAVVLASALFIEHSAAGSWSRLATRFVISISFAGLAAYCGRQSGEHRQVERDARRRQLQLAALNPYLANLPPEVSALLKGQLAAGYFTPEDPRRDDIEGAEPANALFMAQLKDAISALATKGATP